MHHSRILIWSLLVLIGCKTASVSTGSDDTGYYEDLKKLRPDITSTESVPVNNTETRPKENVNYTGHLKTELDSINRIIVARNQQQQYVDGYTIQIYNGTNRQEANDARYRASQLAPNLDPKISYHQPSYKVKVGQYVDRLEAHKIFQEIKEEFPMALLIPERIIVNYD